MEKFNISDKVISKDASYYGEEVGVMVGIDTRKDITRKYLVKFDSLDKHNGWGYRDSYDPEFIIEPYEGYAIWLEDIIKVEVECENNYEEDIKIKFNKIREQKKETIKEMNEKVLEMTLEIKELEAEIEKIKTEYYL